MIRMSNLSLRAYLLDIYRINRYIDWRPVVIDYTDFSNTTLPPNDDMMMMMSTPLFAARVQLLRV